MEQLETFRAVFIVIVGAVGFFHYYRALKDGEQKANRLRDAQHELAMARLRCATIAEASGEEIEDDMELLDRIDFVVGIFNKDAFDAEQKARNFESCLHRICNGIDAELGPRVPQDQDPSANHREL